MCNSKLGNAIMDDIFEEYHNKYKAELEHRTGAYCSYGRGFQIFYSDADCRNTIIQFNLAKIASTYALGRWLVEFQIDIVKMLQKGMIITNAY